jgi:hypothetical protein
MGDCTTLVITVSPEFSRRFLRNSSVLNWAKDVEQARTRMIASNFFGMPEINKDCGIMSFCKLDDGDL